MIICKRTDTLRMFFEIYKHRFIIISHTIFIYCFKP